MYTYMYIVFVCSCNCGVQGLGLGELCQSNFNYMYIQPLTQRRSLCKYKSCPSRYANFKDSIMHTKLSFISNILFYFLSSQAHPQRDPDRVSPIANRPSFRLALIIIVRHLYACNG